MPPRDDHTTAARGRRTSHARLWADLPPAFTARRPPDNVAAPRLREFLADPNDRTRNALVVVYLPITTAIMFGLVNRRRRIPPNTDADTLVADASYATMQAVELWGQVRFASDRPKHFQAFLAAIIRRVIWEEHARRTWGGSAAVNNFHERKKVLAKRIRKLFIRQHGRLPTREERAAELAAMLHNPNIQIGDRPAPLVCSLSGDDVRREAVMAVDPGREVGWAVIDADTVRLAMRGLPPDDRRILKWILAGDGTNDVARKLGVSELTAIHRMSAVLWQGRARADLARCLGVEAESPPRLTASGHLPAPRTLPPARLADAG